MKVWKILVPIAAIAALVAGVYVAIQKLDFDEDFLI